MMVIMATLGVFNTWRRTMSRSRSNVETVPRSLTPRPMLYSTWIVITGFLLGKQTIWSRPQLTCGVLFVNSVINCVKIDLIALFFISHCLLMIVLSKYPKDDDNPNFSTRGEDWAARLTFLYFCQEITRTSFGIGPSDNDNYSLKFSLSALQHVLLCGHRNKFCKFSTIFGWYFLDFEWHQNKSWVWIKPKHKGCTIGVGEMFVLLLRKFEPNSLLSTTY